MRFESFVAARYLRAKRRNRFVSLITVISVAGVSVGVIALIVVMSVMTGFDIALRDTFVGNRAHVTVMSQTGLPMRDWEQRIEELHGVSEHVVAAAPVSDVEALLMSEPFTQPAKIIGIAPELEKNVTDIEANLTHVGGRRYGRGELPGRKELVLGYRLAQNLGVGVGDRVFAITASDKARPLIGTTGSQRVSMVVSGISEAQMFDFDTYYAFTDLATAEMLTGDQGAQMIHMRLTRPELAAEVLGEIRAQTNFYGETWYDQNAAFFGALEQEKAVMFIILVFIVVVAAFNITSTLIMIVMEKRRDIGILRTLGVSGGSILRLFMLEGLMIGLGGTFVGVILGIILALNITPVAEFLASLIGVDLFNSQIYYFDEIPSRIVPLDILGITLAAVVLTFISTLYPAWSAARLNPVDALRYE